MAKGGDHDDYQRDNKTCPPGEGSMLSATLAVVPACACPTGPAFAAIETWFRSGAGTVSSSPAERTLRDPSG